MVDPIDQNTQGIARRKRPRRKPPAFSRFSLYTAVSLFLFGFLFVFAPAYSGSLRFGRLSTLPILWVMASIAVACVGISFAAKRYWKRNVIIWGMLATLSSALVLWAHFSWQSGHADFMRRTTVLHHLGEMVRAASYEPAPIITYAELALPGEYAQDPGVFLLWDSQRTPADVMVGPFTLADIASGAVSREMLRGTLGPVNSSSEWEYIGDFLVSRRNDLLWEEDPKIVMGVSAVYSDDGLRCAMFADGETDRLHVTESWITKQNDYRVSLGLEPLPALP